MVDSNDEDVEAVSEVGTSAVADVVTVVLALGKGTPALGRLETVVGVLVV